ncbi:hypothetical protein TSUD_361690 [Trifolium subterraneum]|uniref:FBD domain-containing protein n=1 Tax=Trifolium subterraneum TaxID=3900 RepID=A0A2Z6M3U7_TRISU|nr:hypothetical protein TSUD_361690 [Trifolium subterraneum]
MDDNDDILQLIIAAIQRRTQTLELDLKVIYTDNNFVSNLFTCRTLTVLKLKGLYICDDIPLEINNNNISPLKTLHLKSVYFETHTHLFNFLLSFPLLEELEANDVRVTPGWSIFVPKKADKIKCLRNLVTAKLSNQEQIPLFLLSRALTSLSIKLTWPCFVHVPVFYNLTQMEIFSDLKHRSWPKKWMWILEMLQNTPKLQHLIIHELVTIDMRHSYTYMFDMCVLGQAEDGIIR